MIRVVATLFALSLVACAREIVEPDVPVSIALDSLPFPSVVVNDTLRDTTGAVRPVQGDVFNYLGELLEGVPLQYFALDRGASVDTATGIVVGDSVRATPVRIIAALGILQTQPRQLAVVERPDSLAVVSGLDTLRYSLTDTTVNFSSQLTVRLFHTDGEPVAVRAWIVSYEIESQADPELATIFGDGNVPSRIDTTSTDGTAGRRIRVSPIHLTSAVDSVVLLATARYRGAHVIGSPARLVVHLLPFGQ